MSNVKGLDLPLLQDSCKRNPKLKKLFELYSARQRGRQACTVPHVRRIMKENGTDLTKQEAIDIMRTWERAGAGKFVSGKADQNNRFIWDWDLMSLSKRVLSPPAPKGVEPAPVRGAPRPRLKLPKLPEDAEVTQVMADAPATGAKSYFVRFNGFEIELPIDMTDKELGEAEAFIKRLQALAKKS